MTKWSPSATRLASARVEIAHLRERLKFAEHIADEYRRIVGNALDALANSRFGTFGDGARAVWARDIQKKLPKKLKRPRR